MSARLDGDIFPEVSNAFRAYARYLFPTSKHEKRIDVCFLVRTSEDFFFVAEYWVVAGLKKGEHETKQKVPRYLCIVDTIYT